MTISKKYGFSFAEVMVTVAILSFGIVLIYKTFFISLDYMNHLTSRLYASNLLNNKIVSLQQQFADSKQIPFGFGQEVESVKLERKSLDFSFITNFKNVEGLENIYQLDVTLSWLENNRPKQLSRSAYISSDSPSFDNLN